VSRCLSAIAQLLVSICGNVSSIESVPGICGHIYGFWTAGQRVNGTLEAPFVWKRMTSNDYQELPLDYTFWKPGEPNNWTGRNEACLHVWQIWQYQWNDQPCTSKICYVCEIDI